MHFGFFSGVRFQSIADGDTDQSKFGWIKSIRLSSNILYYTREKSQSAQSSTMHVNIISLSRHGLFLKEFHSNKPILHFKIIYVSLCGKNEGGNNTLFLNENLNNFWKMRTKRKTN